MGAKKSFAQIVGDLSERSAGKLAAKLPSWAAVAGKLVIPSSLNLEQCSSEAAARFKAGIAAGIAGAVLPGAAEEGASGAGLADKSGCPGSGAAPTDKGGDRGSLEILADKGVCPGSGRPKAIADLTGGLGADAFAFATLFGRVLHNDADASLSAAVQQNFALLGVANVEFSCHYIAPGKLDFVRSFAPDIIYLDPARRDGAGRKVFLLEQCSPDLLSLENELLDICPDVLVKLSPMADLSMLRERLGGSFRTLWVVGLGGECKELLCHLHRGASGLESITLVSLPGASSLASAPLSGVPSLEFGSLDPGKRAVVWDDGPSALAGRIIFEPGAVLSKSGCADALALRLGLSKLSRSTHLFVLPSGPGASAPSGPGANFDQFTPGVSASSGTGLPAPSGSGVDCRINFSPLAEESLLEAFGRRFLVEEVLPFGKAAFREVRQRCPRADVSAHNIPMSSEDLRERLGIRPGGEKHIFGVTVGFLGERALLLCHRCPA